MKFPELFLITLLIGLTGGYKILYYIPRFGKSHVNFSGKIVDILAAAGHDVVVYQPIVDETMKVTGSHEKSVRYYFKAKNESLKVDGTLQSQQELVWKNEGLKKMKEIMDEMYILKYAVCKDVIHDEENLSKLKAENFDLGISELFESCGFGIFELLGIKKIVATHSGGLNTGFSRILGIPSPILGIPSPFSFLPSIMAHFPQEMTFFQRVQNYIFSLIEIPLFDGLLINSVNEAMKEKIPNFDVRLIIRETAMIFVNSDELVDYTTPSTPKLVSIGGLGHVKPKPLAPEYQAIFDSSKKGVIFFSFGSVVQASSMPENIKNAFLEAFEEFPDINFIWKYEKDEHEIAKNLKNVFTAKWLPQNEILEHEKLLAFISHGGMNSVTEAATKGVPMICIPVFGDQPHNAQMMKDRGVGVIVQKDNITKKSIVAAINEILSNPNFKQNAKRLSRMVKAKPMTAEERVVKFTEFAAEFGDSGAFQSEGRHLSYFQLHSLDVIAFLIAIISFASFSTLLIVFCLLRKLCNKFITSSHPKQD
uniref:UDP-glucuronosyltransferase n=1 Tax=Panagrolaimus sp. JU765 TaxID=591449 RepID=A0AC34QFZ1_9BILA